MQGVKKKMRGAAALALLSAALCMTMPAQAAQEAPALRVAASCVPALLAGMSAGAQNVTLFIMPQAGYMEEYALSQPDFLRAQSADVVLLVGGGLESFDQTLYAQGLCPAVAAGEGIERIEGRVIDPDESTQPEENPYVWLSPSRWGQLVHGAAAAFAQIDPDNKAHYAAANEQAQQSVARVAQALEDAMRPYAGTDVVVGHPALSYLCMDAGLNVVKTLERDPSSIPYEADMEDIRALLAPYPDAVLVLEREAPQAFFELPGVKTAACNVLTRAVSAPGAQTWEDAMMENIEALAQALEK